MSNRGTCLPSRLSWVGVSSSGDTRAVSEQRRAQILKLCRFLRSSDCVRWQPENPLPVNEPGGDSTHTWGPDTNRVRYPVFIPPEVGIDALLRSS
jgi:hypothetical protein